MSSQYILLYWFFRDNPSFQSEHMSLQRDLILDCTFYNSYHQVPSSTIQPNWGCKSTDPYFITADNLNRLVGLLQLHWAHAYSLAQLKHPSMYLGLMQMLLGSGIDPFSHFKALPNVNRPSAVVKRNLIFKNYFYNLPHHRL